MTVIDAHVHLHDPGAPLSNHELFAGFEAEIEDLIADHEAHCVDGAVFVPMNAARENLAYASAAVERYDGASAVIGIYDGSVDNPAEAYRNLCSEFEHLRGLRFTGLNGMSDDDIRDLDSWPLLEEFADRGHCLWMYPQLGQYGLVDRIAEELPDLPVVYNLLGFPHPASIDHYVLDDDGLPRISRWDMPDDMPNDDLEQLLESGRKENTYILWGTHWQYSNESYPYLDLADHSQAVVDAFGPDHTAFITDWPWMRGTPGYDRLLELVDVHLPDVSDAARAEIMGGTATRLFDF